MNKPTNIINHVVLVLDGSGSMRDLREDVIELIDSQIEYLAQQSKVRDQETRVTIYSFNEKVTCFVYEKDVLRLPSIREFYTTSGGTALIDGAMTAIKDLQKIPEIYANHGFVLYLASDGQENRSQLFNAEILSKTILGLNDNWTFACFVPDMDCRNEAMRFGFPAENIQIWELSSKGVEEVNRVMRQATDTYMVARSTGARSVKNLFKVDTSLLNKTVVKSVLNQLLPSQYSLLRVSKDKPIKEFVESWFGAGNYVQGSAYYQLTKPETIQAYKQICVQEKSTGKVYSGVEARDLLGLPNYEVKVNPANHTNYLLFIQSTSVNRRLLQGTNLLVLK